LDELPQMASVQNSTDPAPIRQSMASAHNSSNLGPTRHSMASAHNSFDPAPTCQIKASVQISSDPAPECQTMVLKQASLSPGRNCQANVSQGDKTETISEYAQGENDEFINIFSTPVQDRGETSSRHVDSSKMHTFYQHHPFEHRWTKDHPLEHVIENPSQSVRTRRQLESDGEMCMFALTEELHKFDRLDVWELVNRPLCKNAINMKWLWKNKRDEENTVI
nr:hypothetical protein [Tanacetum cinerariifolium]